jgi:hypothetical protein
LNPILGKSVSPQHRSNAVHPNAHVSTRIAPSLRGVFARRGEHGLARRKVRAQSRFPSPQLPLFRFYLYGTFSYGFLLAILFPVMTQGLFTVRARKLTTDGIPRLQKGGAKERRQDPPVKRGPFDSRSAKKSSGTNHARCRDPLSTATSLGF